MSRPMPSSARRMAAGAAVLLLALLGACGDDGTSDAADSAAEAPSDVLTAVDGGEAIPGEAPDQTDQGPEGLPDGNIVGGGTEEIEDFPWVVALRTPGAADNFCGGALIQSNVVMTAAHCVTQTDSRTVVAPSSMEVVLGRTDLNDQTTGDVVGVSTVWTAVGYDPTTLQNDFAVLELTADVDYTPIALPTPDRTDLWTVGQGVATLGWGCEAGFPPGPEKCSERTGTSPLKGALLDVQAVDLCTSYFTGAATSILCMKAEDDGAGICQGDSGGPWAVYEDGKPFLVGITSFNALLGECATNLPQAAAKVGLVTSQDAWVTEGIWFPCEGTEPCPRT